MSPTTRQALVRHTAPVLMDKKPAALFTLPRREQELFAASLAASGLCVKCMRRHRGRVLLLVYRPAHLAQALSSPLAASLLRRHGYPVGAGLERTLEVLRQRIATQQDFPHEIGLFLGYPPEDVAGFIRHKGSRYKLCGLWKVYSDVDRAKALFSEYESCSERLQSHLNGGGDLSDLFGTYGGSPAARYYTKTLEVANG